MSAIDIAAKSFFKNPANFADLFNYKLFSGRQIIRPGDLKEGDSTEIAVPYGFDASAPVQRFRDNLMLWNWGSMTDDNAHYVVLGIESQARVHYAMPVRDMLYDAMNYAGQVQKSLDSYRKHDAESTGPAMTSAEYLSGFRKTDRIMPVVTVVLYLGAKKWDGPLSLHDMINARDRSVLDLVPDYTINLLQPADLGDDDFAQFHSELGQVLEYIHYSEDKAKLHQITHEGTRYRNLDRRSADLLNLASNSKLAFTNCTEKEGTIDVCTAIDEMRKESWEDGLAEGEARGEAKGKASGSRETLITDILNVKESLGVTQERAMDILRVDSTQREGLLSDLAHRVSALGSS